jgi:hypothetical protein
MKIVGGKTVQGTTESGAFVTAIFPGGVADQLHGELKEVSDNPEQNLIWYFVKVCHIIYMITYLNIDISKLI